MLNITKHSFPPNWFAPDKACADNHGDEHKKCQEGNIEKRNDVWDFYIDPIC